ncbi:MAG TPA: KEOPS complex subunit Pcc1 [archaeon]|nr:KEOPS complex subunit Pcc1 [archaeon]
MRTLKVKATISSKYETPMEAESIARALEPDNLELREAIQTRRQGKSVQTRVEVEGIGRALATIDDVLKAQQGAEKVILKKNVI